jgi:hypothetical protein
MQLNGAGIDGMTNAAPDPCGGRREALARKAPGRRKEHRGVNMQRASTISLRARLSRPRCFDQILFFYTVILVE